MYCSYNSFTLPEISGVALEMDGVLVADCLKPDLLQCWALYLSSFIFSLSANLPCVQCTWM